MQADEGNWPTATIAFSSAEPFDNVVVHYLSQPPLPCDWGPIFMADNMQITPAPAPPCPADFNHDAAVGPADLAQLLATWGSCSTCPADLNHDGAVGPADLAQLLATWGPCP
jgi:hypothetical protein